MASFPTFSFGAVSLWPVTETTRRATAALQFTDFTEQRWKRGPTLKAFVLVLEDMQYADIATARSFFDARKGGFDATWDLTIGGTTYQNMCFVEDSLVDHMTHGGLRAASIQVRQVRP